MNPNTQFERDLEEWLQTEAPASAPAGFHAAVMDRARTLRQRPGWATTIPNRRFGRGRDITLLAAAALLVGGALAAGSGILRLPTVVPPVPEPSVIAVATASPDATSPSPSESASPSASPIPLAGPGGTWIQTGSMVTPLGGPAVRLLDGRVLVVGGEGDDLTSAELYDPATGTWSATGKMVEWVDAPPGINLGKEYSDATLLGDGKVLVTASNSAQLYDPASGTWTATGKMIGVFNDTATLLGDGKVLVTGWEGAAQLYDPASGTWTATRKMITPRLRPTATLLSDGRVFVAGGQTPPPDDWTKAAEIYDPVTGSWTKIADMQSGNPGQVLGIATQLPDGKMLVYSRMGAEIYDLTTGTWTVRTGRYLPDPKALLSDGTVLTDGINDNVGGVRDDCAAALYDPRTGSLTPASSMLCGDGSSLTPLLDGTVLVAGGNGAAALYVPAGVPMPPLPTFPSPPPVPDPTPTPTPAPLLPPAVGPTPPNARSWTITVENQSSEPATMFVAEGEEGVLRLVGSATPNVVPAGATMEVTFLFPNKGPDDGWISVNPRLGEGADVGSVGADNIGMPGVIRITAECGGCWVGPAQ